MTDMQNPATLATLISIAAIIWAAACGLQDLLKLKVSNFLTLGMLAVAGLALFRGEALLGGVTVSQALLGLLVAIGLTLPGYVLGKLGAADVKMVMAIGLAAGMWILLETFVVASFLALGLMLVLRQLAGVPVVERLTSTGVLANLAPRPGKSFPYAFCLAIGFISSHFYPFWGV